MPKRKDELHKPCPKCGKPIYYTSRLCRKCTAGLRQHPDALDKFHKPCPKCGKPMYRYSKRCFDCAGLKHRTPEERIEYRRAKNRRSYRHNRDKRLSKDKERYRKDPERFRAKKRAYYQAHKAAVLASAKMSRLAHLEKERADDRAYRLRNHDAVLHKQRERWRKTNPAVHKERRLAYYRSEKGRAYFMRARSKHQDSRALKELKYQLLWDEYRPCAVCGSYDRREVDHVIERSNGGMDDISNLQVLCFAHHRKAGHGRHSAWRAEG